MPFLDHQWWPPTARLSALCIAGLLVTTACAAPSSLASAHSSPTASSTAVPSGVISRADILSRFASVRPGVSTQVKLVRLADLAKASDDSLTQCQVRGCPPGALVWLVLMSGPPGSFGHGVPAGYTPPADDGAWSLVPVDATTGQGRGDSQIGGLSNFQSSPWTSLTDLSTATEPAGTSARVVKQ